MEDKIEWFTGTIEYQDVDELPEGMPQRVEVKAYISEGEVIDILEANVD